MASEWELRVRIACFDALRRAQDRRGRDVLPVDVLRHGVTVDGERIAIFSLYRGIHTPRQLDAALAVTTSPPKRLGSAPYEDGYGGDGLFRYHYRDPASPTADAERMARSDNDAVRRALGRQLPLVYFFGVTPGEYLPFFPVHVVGDDPRARAFALDLTGATAGSGDIAAEAPERRYRAAIVQARMHQARFREAVLRAYEHCCAVCRLRRAELVEAAHIVGDADGGAPVVPNGFALCTLHHAAFDRHVLGVRPDLTVVVRGDVLAEVDGPLLVHGLQGFHDQPLRHLPRRRDQRPAVHLLERRWERFRQAG